MLICRMLTEAAKAEGIDRDPDRAYAWIRKHLPELFVFPRDAEGKDCLDDEGKVVAEPRFDWGAEWPRWRRNLEALAWLVEGRRRPPAPRTEEDRIPRWVDDVVEETVGTTRPVILSGYLSEPAVSLLTAGGVSVTGRFDSLDEFWQVALLSSCCPDLLAGGGSRCAACGKALPPTEKHQKPSRARHCTSCRVAKHRKEHPEETREAWREQKRRYREEEKKSQPPAGRRPKGRSA